MRLDRMDGVGEAAWVDDYSVDAVVQGFFEGLRIIEAKKKYHLGSVNDLLDFLKSLTTDDIRMFYQSILELYKQEKTEDYFLIQSHLDNHIKTLHKVIKGCV